jgi:hypothetical protein
MSTCSLFAVAAASLGIMIGVVVAGITLGGRHG